MESSDGPGAYVVCVSCWRCQGRRFPGASKPVSESGLGRCHAPEIVASDGGERAE